MMVILLTVLLLIALMLILLTYVRLHVSRMVPVHHDMLTLLLMSLIVQRIWVMGGSLGNGGARR